MAGRPSGALVFRDVDVFVVAGIRVGYLRAALAAPLAFEAEEPIS